MKDFKIRYLGTAAAEAYPGVFCMCPACRNAQNAGGKNIRLRSSMLINDEMLIDVSPDFATFKTKYDINVSKLKSILFTHTHNDHFYPDIFSYNCGSFSEQPLKLDIFLSFYAANKIKKHRFEKKIALNNITLHKVKPFKTYSYGDYTITPLKAAHKTPQSLLYIISYKGINMLYGNDTGVFLKETLNYLNNIKLDIVSLDGTNGMRIGQPFRHMGFGEIIDLKNYFLKNNIANNDTLFVVTHFSHWINMLHNELEEYLKPYNIIPAFDGLEL